MEIENLTSQHSQGHIGRVSVLIKEQRLVNESVLLCCDGVEFMINVLEDVAEIIEFGPRYEHSRVHLTNMEFPVDERSMAGSDSGSEANSGGAASPNFADRISNRGAAWVNSKASRTIPVTRSVEGRLKGYKESMLKPVECAKSLAGRGDLEGGVSPVMSAIQIWEGRSSGPDPLDEAINNLLGQNACQEQPGPFQELGPQTQEGGLPLVTGSCLLKEDALGPTGEEADTEVTLIAFSQDNCQNNLHTISRSSEMAMRLRKPSLPRSGQINSSKSRSGGESAASRFER